MRDCDAVSCSSYPSFLIRNGIHGGYCMLTSQSFAFARNSSQMCQLNRQGVGGADKRGQLCPALAINWTCGCPTISRFASDLGAFELETVQIRVMTSEIANWVTRSPLPPRTRSASPSQPQMSNFESDLEKRLVRTLLENPQENMEFVKRKSRPSVSDVGPASSSLGKTFLLLQAQ